MKKCPHCNDFALYDDDVAACPICDTPLVPYFRRGVNPRADNKEQSAPIRPQGTRANPEDTYRETVPQFETESGSSYVYRGMITEINYHARLHNRLKKWVNALFRGEPYQFGNTSHESVIRVEEFHEGRVAGRRRDLIFYGDVEGRFNFGDDVTVYAKRHGDRYIIKEMYLNETETWIKPAPQIPSAVIISLSVFFGFMVIYLLTGIFKFITSGALKALLTHLISMVISILMIVWFIRSLFRRH